MTSPSAQKAAAEMYTAICEVFNSPGFICPSKAWEEIFAREIDKANTEAVDAAVAQEREKYAAAVEKLADLERWDLAISDHPNVALSETLWQQKTRWVDSADLSPIVAELESLVKEPK